MRQELKETYSALEEAKADISSLFAIQYLIDKGVLPKSLETPAVHDVPGVDVPVDPLRRQRGARPRHRDSAQLPARPGRRHRPRATARLPSTWRRSKQAVAGLTRDIMTIQAEGNYAEAKELRDRLGVVRPPVQAALDKMTHVPVDIEPQFTTADQLVAEAGGAGA